MVEFEFWSKTKSKLLNIFKSEEQIDLITKLIRKLPSRPRMISYYKYNNEMKPYKDKLFEGSITAEEFIDKYIELINKNMSKKW